MFLLHGLQERPRRLQPYKHCSVTFSKLISRFSQGFSHIFLQLRIRTCVFGVVRLRRESHAGTVRTSGLGSGVVRAAAVPRETNLTCMTDGIKFETSLWFLINFSGCSATSTFVELLPIQESVAR